MYAGAYPELCWAVQRLPSRRSKAKFARSAIPDPPIRHRSDHGSLATFSRDDRAHHRRPDARAIRTNERGATRFAHEGALGQGARARVGGRH